MTRAGYAVNEALIKAWYKGATVEEYDKTLNEWVVREDPSWDQFIKYRIKVYPFKQGDRIIVKNENQPTWQERTFVRFENTWAICIAESKHGSWVCNDDNSVKTHSWQFSRPLPGKEDDYA